MKKFLSLTATLMLAATAAMAQTAPPPQKPAGTAPAAPSAAGTTAEAPKVAKAPEAKSQEEFKAYQAATAVTDSVAAEAAADDFAKKYPTSELRVVVYGQILQKAYEAGDSPRVIQLGRKFLAVDPTSPMTLVVTATAIAETTKDTDLDAEQKYGEATKYVDSALQNIETMLPQPGVAPPQFEMLKSVLRNMAYTAKGYMDMNKKDFPAAEKNFQRAIDANPAQPDPTLYLRLAVAQDSQRRFAPAFANATKAMELAQEQNNTSVANLARSERDRLQRLMGNPAAAKPATPSPAPPKQ